MRALGFALAAILAVAFLSGVIDRAGHRRAPPRPAEAATTADRLVGVEEGMRRYLTDTPGELARLRSEQARQLRVLCRDGYAPARDCPKTAGR